ncbi:MAG TPA: Gfo/Idh/MocA family oxidoreductase [Blastocatellia bacterium]|nr:Gfo/Idh/MocA family oxidoreductase [Blastocatellia bacterium]
MFTRTRRNFLRQSLGLTAAAAGMNLLTGRITQAGTARSYRNILGANRRVRLGLIGCGGQGTSDLRAALRLGNTELVAMCDVDDRQIPEAIKKIQKRDGLTLSPQLATRDFRKLLEVKDLDAVIIGTPDHWHALTMIYACMAGKDVYVEKPLSLTIAEGRAMVDAARRYSRVVQMGTQQRSAPHYKDAVEYVQSGQLGKIRAVRCWAYQDWMGNIGHKPDSDPPPEVDYDFWLGPAPKRPFNENRFHFNFRWFYDYSGGLMTDWGAHMIDIANWAMKLKAPLSAASVGGKFGFPDNDEETPDTQQAIWDCGDYSMIWEHATAIGQGPFMRDHGVAFHGNNGILVVDRGGWEVYPETDGSAGRKKYKNGAASLPRQSSGGVDYHQLHVKNWLDCLDSRRRPNSDVEIGHNSMIALHLGNIAYRTKRTIRWDVEKERVIGDTEAQRLVAKDYRAPWRLPTLS